VYSITPRVPIQRIDPLLHFCMKLNKLFSRCSCYYFRNHPSRDNRKLRQGVKHSYRSGSSDPNLRPVHPLLSSIELATVSHSGDQQASSSRSFLSHSVKTSRIAPNYRFGVHLPSKKRDRAQQRLVSTHIADSISLLIPTRKQLGAPDWRPS
jgi:hypothetical protein